MGSVIQFQNVSKCYGDQIILSNISISFEMGSIWCLMGESGTGKTTFLSLLLGLEQPDSGTIIGIKPPFSAVFQENRLCEAFDAVENIRLVTGKKLTSEKIQEAFLKVGISEGFKKPVAKFSGGMKRRVAVVRAVLSDGNFLVMDEPFQGLDAIHKKEVIRFILEYRNQRTLILTTHEPEDRYLLNAGLLELNKGKLTIKP